LIHFKSFQTAYRKQFLHGESSIFFYSHHTHFYLKIGKCHRIKAESYTLQTSEQFHRYNHLTPFSPLKVESVFFTTEKDLRYFALIFEKDVNIILQYGLTKNNFIDPVDITIKNDKTIIQQSNPIILVLGNKTT
jgi:hypothetical protein